MFEEVRRCGENFNKVEKRGLNYGSLKHESSEEETSSAATTSPSTKSGNDATYAEFTFPSIDASTSTELISNLSSGSIGSLLYNTYEPIDLNRALIDMTKEHIHENYGSSKCESSKEETSSAATTSTSSTKSRSDETYVSLSLIDASTSKDSISSKSSITNLSSASVDSFFCNNYEPVDSSRPLISVGSYLYNNYEPVDTSRSLIDMTKKNIYENYGSLKNMYDKSENVESPLPYAGSPPTYQVCETKDGRLINKTLNIVYPNHPAETKKLFDGYIWKQQPRPQSLPPAPSAVPTTKAAASSTSTLSYPTTDSFTFTTSTSSDLDTTKFIGPATLETVNKKLLSNDFIIFYALPDIKPSTDDNDLPSNLPLRIAFQSTNGKTYYLPIKRKEHQWRIKFPNGKASKGFLTIQKLIEHCYSFGYLNPSTGAYDMFPLNLLENTSE